MHVSLQKTTTWTNKNKKGRQEWANVCRDASLYFLKLKMAMKTWFASKVNICKKKLWSFRMPLIYVIQAKKIAL
jgi:hypothetical protein